MRYDAPTAKGFARGRISLSDSERMKFLHFFIEKLFKAEKIQDLMGEIKI